MVEYRGYAINPVPNLIAHQIEYIGKGSIHNCLRGYFTDINIAKKFIDDYLDIRKEDSSGKIVQRRRSKQVQRGTNNRRKSVNLT